MKVEDKIRLGDWLYVDHKLERTCEGRTGRRWSKKTIDKVTVLVVGKRTLLNGNIYRSGTYDDYEEYFDITESFQAYLVVANIRRKPFYVIL